MTDESGQLNSGFVDPATLNLRRVQEMEGDWAGDAEVRRVTREEPEPEQDEQDDPPEDSEADETATENADAAPEEDAEEPAAEEDAPADDDAPPEGVSIRAQDRFRNLANERKQAQEELRAERARNAALAEQLSQAMQMQTELLQTARDTQKQNAQRMQQIRQAEELRAAGYDESQIDSVIASMAREQEVSTKLERIEAQLKQAQFAEQKRQYTAALEGELRTALRDRNVDDKQIDSLLKTAYSNAVTNRLTPDAAVAATLAPIINYFPKKVAAKAAKPKKPLTTEETNALRATAKSGKTGGNRKPGDSSSGQPRKRTVFDMEKTSDNGW